MRPFSTPGANFYCRLLPPDEEGKDVAQHQQALSRLGLAMQDDESLPPVPPENLVEAGYTYFGQFLDHDTTGDPSSLDEAWRLAPEQIQNTQSARLDLSHLYGRGPFHPVDSRLYDGVRFKIGAKPPGAASAFDLGPDPAGQPLAADDRTLENVIIRQIACVFARLHNAAVAELSARFSDPAELFYHARLRTIWQFQWFVWNDFLLRLLDRGVYQQVFEQRRPLIEWEIFSIPVEFSVAAMRFGHSIVRESYFLAAGERNHRSLREIFAPDLQKSLLPAEWEIDWGFFFLGASSGGSALASRPLDARITPALHNIPAGTKRLYNETSPGLNAAQPPLALQSLPVRTLLRGAGLHLSTGQAAARLFGESVLSEDELINNRSGQCVPPGKVLRDERLATATPLWYYILKESEVRSNGNRLGPVGSRILAETFYGALLHDPDSILNHPDAYLGPPEWQIGGSIHRFTNLRALFEFARHLP